MKISIRKNNILSNPEKAIQILICFIIGFTTVSKGAIILLRSIVVLPMKLDTIIMYSIYMLIVFLSLKIIFKRVKKDSVVLLFFLIAAYSISLLIGVQEYSLKIGFDLLMGFMIYVVTRSLNKNESLAKYLNIMSILIVLSVVIIYLLLPSKEVLEESYSQNFGYSILPAAIISFNAFFDKKSLLHLIIFLLAFTLVTMAGARGPFVISILFVVIRVSQVGKGFNKKKRFFAISLAVITMLILAVVLWPKVEELVITHSAQGANRITDRIESDNILEDNARSLLVTKSVESIISHPFGMGIGQEREEIALDPTNVVGYYPHNFFLEIFLHYGIVIGVILIFLLLHLMYASFFKNKNTYTKNLWLIFFSLGFLPLMISGTYIGWTPFWLFLGFSVNIFYENKFAGKN